jgi:hypothetical protein
MYLDSEENGDRAIEYFKKENFTKKEENVDLIIMDFNMINMNGD